MTGEDGAKKGCKVRGSKHGCNGERGQKGVERGEGSQKGGEEELEQRWKEEPEQVWKEEPKKDGRRSSNKGGSPDFALPDFAPQCSNFCVHNPLPGFCLPDVAPRILPPGFCPRCLDFRVPTTFRCPDFLPRILPPWVSGFQPYRI